MNKFLLWESKYSRIMPEIDSAYTYSPIATNLISSWVQSSPFDMLKSFNFLIALRKDMPLRYFLLKTCTHGFFWLDNQFLSYFG